MQFPENWLREFCNPDLTTQELADTLTMAGLEVEDVEPAAPVFNNVVVGQITSTEKHPDADRLQVCSVDLGAASDEPLSIVCGASNARVGIKIPCAMVGAKLPTEEGAKPFVIKKSKLRGVPSHGMLCSTDELGLPDDGVNGLLELPDDAPVGVNIRDYLQLDEPIFTIKLTPNLGHCLSILGVAQELSAVTGAPVKPFTTRTAAVAHDAALPVTVEADDLCGRFSGRIVRGVDAQNATTPDWMKRQLERCGQRPVSPLVDISNYVMFEMGQPNHIFDAAMVQGGLHVRWGKAGEQLKLLNGNTIELDEQVGVIADDNGVESLAGIMGGDACAVSDSTTDIYIEAAHWHPDAVAGRSRRYQFATEAGHRFERGVDPELTIPCIERITELVQGICGGEAGPITDQVTMDRQPRTVQLRAARAAKVIGIPVTPDDCTQVFQRLGFAFSESDGVFDVQIPLRRFDITLEEDLIEEVARLYGYDKLQTEPPQALVRPCVRPSKAFDRFALREQLMGLGYTEVINYAFVPDAWESDLAGQSNPIKLLNPIASQLNVMRSSLVGSLLQVLKHNLDRGTQQVRIFELAKVFSRNVDVATTLRSVQGVEQRTVVAGLLHGDALPEQWSVKNGAADFFDIKGDVEQLLPSGSAVVFRKTNQPALHPGRSAEIVVNGNVAGMVGELHPRWKQKYELPKKPVLVFELDVSALTAQEDKKFGSVSKYQSVERDLAIVLSDAQTYATVESAIAEAKTQYVRDVQLFDVYKPKEAVQGMDANEKSLAIKLLLSSDESTLTDELIQADLDVVLAKLTEACGARLRA